MRKIIAFLLIINNSLIHAQTYKNLIHKADSCYTAENYKTSVDYYEKAFKIEHTKPNDFYNAACSAALSKQDKKAFKWLNLAIDNGYENITHLQIDADLKSLHENKEWKNTTEKFQKKLDILEAHYDKPLQKELLAIYAEDQDIRGEFMKIYKDKGPGNKSFDSINNLMRYKDSINLLKVIKILDEKGWVGKDIVGSQANQTLFLVIQHADLKYQQKYMPMMREAVKKGNANGASLALMEDRVSLREGRKQIYGSQIGRDNETKIFYVSSLEDPDNVDERRAKIGLPPMADYVSKWQIKWDVEQYKKDLPALMIKEKIKN
ncbi:DUF6624 domain-containing protein [Flavobacterium aquicola]|uniref:Tetratricopeptide repeat protein n=1 Tax=Flavobacterium aquicola TaxID=1682742 RepID=A0A3E0EDW2_9FLAO|nr:DUF6624 domain-containing protein [Flavobacterium aquicola]REG96468.1 hypothetical protein C8P67_109116 [Flavobacterium aquicola]